MLKCLLLHVVTCFWVYGFEKNAGIKLLLMLLSLCSLYPGFLLLIIPLDQVIMRNLPFLHVFSIFAKEGWVHWDRYELGVIFEASDAQPNMSAAGYPPGSFNSYYRQWVICSWFRCSPEKNTFPLQTQASIQWHCHVFMYNTLHWDRTSL